jgi:hypothetical protein
MELFDPEAAGELDDEAMAEKQEKARIALEEKEARDREE